MPRPADFKDAHSRHWIDAELLFVDTKWANADHLYGFSVECGLKAVMAKLGMRLDGSGSPKQGKYRTHVNELWPKFKTFAQGRNGSWYVKKLPGGEPFKNWAVQDRYAHRQGINQSDVAAHRVAAKEVFNLLKKAQLEGRL